MKKILTATALIAATATASFASTSFDELLGDAVKAGQEAKALRSCAQDATTYLVSDGKFASAVGLTATSMDIVVEQTNFIMEAVAQRPEALIDELAIALVEGGKEVEVVRQYRAMMRDCYGL